MLSASLSEVSSNQWIEEEGEKEGGGRNDDRVHFDISELNFGSVANATISELSAGSLSLPFLNLT